MKLSVVIPLLNEEKIVHEVYRRLIVAIKKDFSEFDYEIIFIDDGSDDNTFNELKKIRYKNKKIKIIQFSRNFGHHLAITAGLDNAKGDYIVMMDGDLQDKPEEIIKLYKKIKEGYDVVYAIRKNKQFNYFKKITSKIFNFILKKLIHEKIVINSTIFRIITHQVLQESNRLREKNRYLVGIFGWSGFSHAGVEVDHGKRFSGKTKYTFAKQVELALNAIFSYTSFPLSLAVRISMLLVLIAILLILILLYSKLMLNKFESWQIILTTILLIGAVQTFFLGLIGEYVGRTYIENKDRPLYVIKTKLL